MEWNEDVIARLRALWNEGLSTAEIGRRLGVSKNAVVGKAHRMMLPARPSPIRREGSASPRPAAPRRVTGPTLPPLPASCLPQPACPGPPAYVASGRPAPAIRPPRLSSHSAILADGMGVTAGHGRSPSPGSALPAHDGEPAAPIRVVAAVSGRQSACCWPLGDPGTKSFRFCDATSLPGKPYCTEHAQVAYVKVRDRREEAA